MKLEGVESCLVGKVSDSESWRSLSNASRDVLQRRKVFHALLETMRKQQGFWTSERRRTFHQTQDLGPPRRLVPLPSAEDTRTPQTPPKVAPSSPSTKTRTAGQLMNLEATAGECDQSTKQRIYWCFLLSSGSKSSEGKGLKLMLLFSFISINYN